jgi:hypothetical protein
MYLVVHDDKLRGDAIVAALGGEPAARRVDDVAALYMLSREQGKPAAALIAADASGPTGYTRLSGLKGVPILYDGGSSAAIYRAFVSRWRDGQPFHHLAAATPEEAARELVRCAGAPGRAAPRVWWRAIEVMGFLGVGAGPILRVLHAHLPAGGRWPLVEWLVLAVLLLALALMVGLPVLAARARSLRPTRSAVAWAVLMAVYAPVMLWLTLREMAPHLS